MLYTVIVWMTSKCNHLVHPWEPNPSQEDGLEVARVKCPITAGLIGAIALDHFAGLERFLVVATNEPDEEQFVKLPDWVMCTCSLHTFVTDEYRLEKANFQPDGFNVTHDQRDSRTS